MARIVVTATLLGTLLTGCSGQQLPAFCGVTDDARVTIGEAPQAQWSEIAKGFVDDLQEASRKLSGDQGALAGKVTAEFEAASKADPGSLEFSRLYNRFVRDSNEFDHRYCVETEGPEF